MSLHKEQKERNPNLSIDSEFWVCVLCCRVYLGDSMDALSTYLKNEHIDYPKLFQIAAIQKIRPVLYQVLHNCPSLTPELKPLIQRRLMHITSVSMAKAQSLFKNIELFESAGIETAVYKGFGFAQQFYKKVFDRETGDIDLAIQKEDIEKAAEVARTNGFYDRNLPSIASMGLPHFLNYYKDYCLEKYEGSKRTELVELHHRPFGSSYKIPASLGVFPSKKREKICLQQNCFHTLDKLAHLKLVIIHHSLQDRLGHLRSLLDLALAFKMVDLPEGDPIQSYLKIELIKKNIQTLFYDNNPNPLALRGMSKELLSSGFFKNKEKSRLDPLIISYRNLSNALRYIRHYSDKFKYLSGTIQNYFSPQAPDFQWIYLPRSLYFLYFFLRPIRILLKYVK